MYRSHPLKGLRLVRKGRGMTAPEAARHLGMEVASYYRLENGSRRAHFDHVLALADLLHVPIDDFMHPPCSEWEMANFLANRDAEEKAEALRKVVGIEQKVSEAKAKSYAGYPQIVLAATERINKLLRDARIDNYIPTDPAIAALLPEPPPSELCTYNSSQPPAPPAPPPPAPTQPTPPPPPPSPMPENVSETVAAIMARLDAIHVPDPDDILPPPPPGEDYE